MSGVRTGFGLLGSPAILFDQLADQQRRTIWSAVPSHTGDPYLEPDIDAAIRLVLKGAFLHLVPDDLRPCSGTWA